MANVENILTSVQQRQLTALKSTARSLDKVQLELATGKDVNSAIDNPQNFFASRFLENRANDLRRLLDGINQSLRTIEEAQNGLDATFNILDTAEAFLINYQEELIAGGEKYEKQLVEPLEINSNADLTQYAGSQDDGFPATFFPGGFTLDNNSWRRFQVDIDITEETVLEFEFQSSKIPEINAIGFDNDNSFSNNSNFFFLYGEQLGGISYAVPTPTYEYDGSGDFVKVSIPVGELFTGTFSHLVFINDDDMTDGDPDDGDGSYRNIQLGFPDFTAEAKQFFDDNENEYSKILDQIDRLSVDASYRGINLLKDENLETFFNADRTSSLITGGIDATSEGLGLVREDFTSVEAIETKITQIREAREDLREYSRSLTSDFSTLETRNNFTRTTINNLASGSDDLILVDQNEAGAELLALQTRQSIQIRVLSFIEPSVLRLLA